MLVSCIARVFDRLSTFGAHNGVIVSCMVHLAKVGGGKLGLLAVRSFGPLSAEGATQGGGNSKRSLRKEHVFEMEIPPVTLQLKKKYLAASAVKTC